VLSAIGGWLNLPALLPLGVSELRFSSIHAMRTIRTGARGRRGRRARRILSRHALGLAMDVFEIVGPDGAKLVVASDYGTGTGVLGAAERAINATGAFRMLLTPGNDPRAHDDHFHLEARTPGDRIVTPPATMPATQPTTAPAAASPPPATD
jgi:hypothetical protein